MKKIVPLLFLFAIFACDSPPNENIYRRDGNYPSGVNVPVAFLVSEWAGKPRILASGWLVDGSDGMLFSAKHFTDAFMKNTVEFGANECKVFLGGKVYSCVVVQLPPLRDAVIIKMLGSFNRAELPKPYKISKTKTKPGDKVFIQGFHPHPAEVTKSNLVDGLKDIEVPIMDKFYEIRDAELKNQQEVVFDNLKGKVVKPDPNAILNNPLFTDDRKGDLLVYENDSYIKVLTIRDHKFSFGGLSGGVVLNENGEAIGVVTAQDIYRFEYDKDGFLINPSKHSTSLTIKKQNFDIMYITPIESVMELYNFARYGR